MSSFGIVATILVCLAVGHLAIAAFFPSVAINAVGVVLVTLIIGYVLFVRGDVFSTLLIVFACSQFEYAVNQGGLFNLVAFLLFAVYLLTKPAIRETSRANDVTVTSLLLILFIHNLLGVVLRNPMPLPVRVLEFSAFTGMLLAFHVASLLELTGQRMRQFMVVLGVMAVLNFLVSLNQHYAFIQVATPVLGLDKDLFYATTNAYGTFGSASANGQYVMMVLALILPLLAASASQTVLGLRPMHFVPIAIAAGLTLILANMRAAVLEAGLIVVIYTIMFSLLHRRWFRNAKYVNMASAAVVILLATVGVWFNLDNIARDFDAVQVKNVSTIESGEALNRLGPWQFGWQRLQSEAWLVGYGHGNDESNQIAWGGRQAGGTGGIIGGGHLHNLYLALPMMFGWGGAIAYVLLFLVVVFRLFGAVRRHSLGNLAVVTCLGFLMSLGFFLLDEVKSGNAVQTINYAMVIWIWLGLGLAARRTLQAGLAAERIRRAAASASGGATEEPPEGAGVPAGAGRGAGPGVGLRSPRRSGPT